MTAGKAIANDPVAQRITLWNVTAPMRVAEDVATTMAGCVKAVLGGVEIRLKSIQQMNALASSLHWRAAPPEAFRAYADEREILTVDAQELTVRVATPDFFEFWRGRHVGKLGKEKRG